MVEHVHEHDWRPVPILPYVDPAATAAFWTSLGFRVVDGSPDATPYLLAVRDGAELHFTVQPGLDPATATASCYVAVPDVDPLHVEWTALGLAPAGLPSLTTPEMMPWGLREMVLVDPNGSRVRFATSG